MVECVQLVLDHNAIEEFIKQLAELRFGWVVLCVVQVPEYRWYKWRWNDKSVLARVPVEGGRLGDNKAVFLADFGDATISSDFR